MVVCLCPLVLEGWKVTGLLGQIYYHGFRWRQKGKSKSKSPSGEKNSLVILRKSAYDMIANIRLDRTVNSRMFRRLLTRHRLTS